MGEIYDSRITGTTTIWKDNQSAIAYFQNALVSEKTKHIGLKWHFLKDHVELGTIRLIEIEIVYNMYRVKPAAVFWPSQLLHVGNLPVGARP
jgi:hypothetical protein